MSNKSFQPFDWFKNFSAGIKREMNMFSKSPTKWLRKRNKALLVVFGTILMIVFLLPTALIDNYNRSIDEVIGQYTNFKGEPVEVRTSDLRRVERDLGVLRSMSLDMISSLFSNPDFREQLSEFPEIGQSPNQMFSLLVLSNQFQNIPKQSLRNMFQEQARGWVETEQDRERLYENIDGFLSAESNELSLYYLLLTEESRAQGVRATQDQVNKLISIYQQLRQSGQIRNIPISTILNEFNLIEEDFFAILSDYIGVLVHAQVATRPLALSEAELKSRVFEELGSQSVKGSYVSFDSSMFMEEIEEPTDEQMLSFFDKYKNGVAGATSEDNPYGFGYMLPARVQVEYLRVDLTALREQERADLESNSRVEQEEMLTKFWLDNRMMFREQMPQEEENPEQPQFRDPEFDEIYSEVEGVYINQQARDKAQQALAEAKRQVQSLRSGDVQADYEKISENISTDSLKVEYGKTNYFSQESGGPEDLRLAETYKMKSNTPTQSSLELLFQSEPFQQGVTLNMEAPPVKMYEDITPLETLGRQQADAALIMRLVGVDFMREPESIEDDGRQGPAGNEPLPDSRLRTEVKSDWQSVQAYQKTMEQAREFAVLAREKDWETAITETRSKLTDDPNQPEFMQPLRESTLDSIRQRNQQIRNQMNQMNDNPQLLQMYIDFIESNNEMLRKALKRARKNEDQQEGIAVLEQPETFRCLVFKGLTVDPPTIEEYNERKPAVARGILNRHQSFLSLIHFNPENIFERNAFVRLNDMRGEADQEG